MQTYRDLFNQYVKTFDIKDKKILLKFHHTYRVVEYARLIAESIGADLFKAELCALFHDIARFTQWERYHTFDDSSSVNHGDLGCTIIKEHFKDLPYLELVLFTTRNHNKYEIQETENEEYKLYTKIVRDADKIDILLEQGNEIHENDLQRSEEVFSSILKQELVKNQEVKNEVDEVIQLLSFVFDIYFSYTFSYLLEKRIIENKVHLLSCYTKDRRFEEIEDHLKKYMYKKVEG